jgi:hypothetical protein
VGNERSKFVPRKSLVASGVIGRRYRLTGSILNVLPLDLEADFDGYLEFVYSAVDDATAFLNDLKPIHVADGFGSFGDTGLDRFGKAYGRSSNQLDDFVGACHFIPLVH